MLGALLGIVLFSIVDLIVIVSLNSWTYVHWSYFQRFFIRGFIFSVFPAGITGTVLAYILQKETQNNIITNKKIFSIGGKFGIICSMLTFTVILLLPGSIFPLTPATLIIKYFILPLTLSYILGGWVGIRIANTMKTQ